MIEDEIYAMKDIKCCACGCKLASNAGMNPAITMKRATWKCPVYGSFDIPDYPPRAVAIVCDECARDNIPVRFCVEFQGAGLVTYHDVESLEDISEYVSKLKYYFGRRTARAWKLVLSGARQQCEN